MKRSLEGEVELVELPSEVWSLIFSLVGFCDARLWLFLLSLTTTQSTPRGWFEAITSMKKLSFPPLSDSVYYYDTEKVLGLMKKFPLLSSIGVVYDAFVNVQVLSLDRIKELYLIGPHHVIIDSESKSVLLNHLPNLESLDIGTYPIGLIPKLLSNITENSILRITTLRAPVIHQMDIDKFTNLHTLKLKVNLKSQSITLDNLQFIKKVSIRGNYIHNVIPDMQEKQSIEISMKNRAYTMRGDFSVLDGKLSGQGSMELHRSKRIFTGQWKDGLPYGVFILREGGDTKEVDSLEPELLKLLSTC